MNWYKINIPSPAFVLDENKLLRNLKLVHQVAHSGEVDIILALKGFAMWHVFPLINQYLNGATASSLHEARLIFEEMGIKAHTYAPAYIPDEFRRIISYSRYITFNSLKQFESYQSELIKRPDISIGLRVNPEYSPVTTDLYNPASPTSRLGELAQNIKALPERIEGLHFHVLCESNVADLKQVLAVFEANFSRFFHQIKWVNFGGGHLMTKEGYDVAGLIQLLRKFRSKYGLKVILEPGSAIAWQTGSLVTSILDIIENAGVKTAIIDASFTAHMPDTLEMPYRPKIIGATDPIEGKPTYRIGGISCLAGDYMSEYSFGKPLMVGDRIIFEDMMHYTMVKTTTFNGVKHPSICILKQDGTLEIVRQFGYEDFKNRLS